MVLRSKDYLLVGLQGVILLLYIFDLPVLQLKFPAAVRSFGLVFSILGALVVILAMLQLHKNLSPFPTPRAGAKLIKNGLYKYVRHPVYSGIMIACGGYAIFSLSGYRVLLCLLLYVLFVVKVRYEEKQLMRQFNSYSAYRKKTGTFLPKCF